MQAVHIHPYDRTIFRKRLPLWYFGHHCFPKPFLAVLMGFPEKGVPPLIACL